MASTWGAWNPREPSTSSEWETTAGERVRLRLLVLAMAATVLGCSATAADDLLGEQFVSVAVEQDGQSVILVEGPVELEFEDRRGDHVVRWNAGCNTVGGVFEITSDQLRPDRTSDGQPEFDSTAVDCPQDHHEQDDWLAEVFASSPEWTLAEDGILQVLGDGVRLTFEPA